MKKLPIPLVLAIAQSLFTFSQTTIVASRMNEVFQQTILAGGPTRLYDPWEITYGPDGFLWITEARGYKVYRMDPNTGAKTTVLDISNGSTFLPIAYRSFNCQFPTPSQNPWPQGGMAGLVIHPDFMNATTPKKYVYVSYVRTYDSTSVITNGGVFFTNRVVRFTYDTVNKVLGNPVSLCDTLPGSSDHNSQRMVIAPVSGTNYLFYAQGDMGAGQFGNAYRANKAQITASYQGKILSFNLESDGDPGVLDQWIPNDNPFNGASQSAVWSTGIRNNQGFAYANINGTDFLYGASHGPFSDDEVNIIQKAKNYGHPLVIGFNDGNYDGAKAAGSASSLPLITSEAANATAIGASYTDPIYSFYAAPKGNTTTPGTIQYIYNQFNTGNQNNSAWPSEAPSGMDIYTNPLIPGWKNSLLLASLKGGKMIRLQLNSSGTGIVASPNDTINYFWSKNRFRDLAFSPDGKSVFVVIDSSAITSGPTSGNPVVSTCRGCVIEYTFLGYNYNSNKSTIPSTIPVTTGTANSCTGGTSITIDNTNNMLWVPITGPDGNIMAEIKANGNNLGVVTSSFYYNSGTVREDANHRLYLDRNLTITPTTQPSSAVSIRLYLSSAELTALINAKNSQGLSSGVTGVNNLDIRKNQDACGSSLAQATTTYTQTFSGTQTGGYWVETNIPSFSSFYLGNASMITLPVQLVYFKGGLVNNNALL
jgi:PQQ-dependent dehydrogenase (s-GDH family)